MLGGYTRITSLLTGPGAVAHTGIHPAVQGTGLLPGSGAWAGAALARAAAAWARSPFLRLVVEPDVQLSMWRKLAIMAPYSALCAATRCPIGPLLDDPKTRALLRAAVAEVVAVGRAAGVGALCDPGDVDASLAVLATLPPGCTPSMQRDLLAGRPSELDDQAGAVVRLAGAHGVAAPTLGALAALLGPLERVHRGTLVLPAHTEGDAQPMDSFIEYNI